MFLAANRKDEGIYYTPAGITGPMADSLVNSLAGKLVDEICDAAGSQKCDFVRAEKPMAQLAEIRVADTACGSGGFLIKVLRAFWRQYQRIDGASAWVERIIKPENGDVVSKALDTVNGNALWLMITGVSTAITVVHRSDSSGTTKGFTTFLAAYSPTWKSGPGVDKDIKWPTGTGAKGNDGVAAAVKQTDGAIGYVEQAYALQNNFTFADIKNKSGAFIAPTLASTSASAVGLTIPPDLGISTINSANPADSAAATRQIQALAGLTAFKLPSVQGRTTQFGYSHVQPGGQEPA